MTALSVKQNNKKDDNIKTRNRIYEQHKAHGHTTEIALCVNSLRRRRSGG